MRKLLLLPLATILLVAPLTACSSSRHIDLSNVGRACVVLDEGVRHVDAVVDNCASSCAENLDLGCEVTLEGMDIIIDTWASYDVSDEVCIQLCNELRTTCEVPSLEPGTYTLKMGATETPLIVPDDTQDVCVEQYGV